jgi:hypothetical protein
MSAPFEESAGEAFAGERDSTTARIGDPERAIPTQGTRVLELE